MAFRMTREDKRTKWNYRVQLVAFHITHVCSHRCPFCYFADDNIKPKHPTLQDLLRVIKNLIAADVKEITLLGGDPGAYPEAVPLARYAAEAGISVSILSNTLRFPKSSIEEAARYISAFETTIHDVTPERHDMFCKVRGAYEFVVSRLRRAGELGRKTGIELNVTASTAGRLYDIVSRIIEVERVPLSYVVVQRIVPFGRAAHSSEFTLTRALAEKALYEIEKIDKHLGINIAVEDPFPLCILPQEVRKYMIPCAWGFTKAAVNENGDVSRCGRTLDIGLAIFLKRLCWKYGTIRRSFGLFEAGSTSQEGVKPVQTWSFVAVAVP